MQSTHREKVGAKILTTFGILQFQWIGMEIIFLLLEQSQEIVARVLFPTRVWIDVDI